MKTQNTTKEIDWPRIYIALAPKIGIGILLGAGITLLIALMWY